VLAGSQRKLFLAKKCADFGNYINNTLRNNFRTEVRSHAKRPKNKCTFIAPSCGLFLTCRREKYIVLI
jgi:hypothetical protein